MTNTTTVRMGRHTILPKSLEDQLFEYTLTMSDMFFGLTQDKLRSIAYELACRNGIKHPFDHESKKAGKDWLYGFLKRYPSLSLRSPEPTSLSRAIGFRKTEVETFYNNLEKVLSKENIQATDVYNCDEVGMSSVQKPQKVLAKKGKKQVGQIVSAEKGETTTALVCMSAGGNFIPPMLIFKRKNMNKQLMKDAPTGSISGTSPTGWINTQLFTTWMRHFIKHTRASLDHKVLLVLDNHESHQSIETYELCRSNGVIMVSLPPHTSHRLQPLDVTLFSSLKVAYNKECDLYMSLHPGQRITQYEIAQLFKLAYNRTATMSKAINGFETTGIIPFNRNKFSEEDFAPVSAVMSFLEDDNPVAGERSQLEDTSEAASTITAEDHITTEILSETTEGTSTRVEISITSEAHEDRVQSTTSVISEAPDDLAQGASTSMEGITSETRNFIMTLVDDLIDYACSIKNNSSTITGILDIAPIPKATSRSKNKKRRKTLHSEILTSTPFKDVLIKKKLARDKRESKAKNKGGQKTKEPTVRRRLNLSGSKAANRRMIKGKSKMSNKGKSLVRKKAVGRDIPEEKYDCIFCNEPYVEPPVEDWVMCVICKNWAHEKCTDGVKRSESYTCDICK